MKKIYSSAGIEVKMTILGPITEGYICPSCGQNHCFRHHCLRCGQPLVYDEWQAENYVEIYKNVDEECRVVDDSCKGEKNPLTNEPIPSLADIRKNLNRE